MHNLEELSKEQLLEIIIKQGKRIQELEKVLALYTSPHLSSSKQFIKNKEKEESKEPPKKKGAPEGHEGASRLIPKPDKTIDLKPERCAKAKCKSKKIEILKAYKKTIEDIVITKTATEFLFYDCKCKRCGTAFTTTSKDLPKEGRFGPNIISLWATLHYIGTVPFERLSKISKNLFHTEITPAAIHNILYRNAKIFKPQFERRKRTLARSRYVRSDETSYSVNGKKWYLWNLSNGKTNVVLIRNSRGSKVLKEVFGDFLDAILNSDCFSAYSKFKAREYQKCWAHVLRDAENLAKFNDEGKELHKLLLEMYQYIKNAKDKNLEDTAKIKTWIRKQKKKIDSWLDKNYASKAVKNLVLRMSKYKNDWFTCLKYSFVEATNNGSERDIRKNVLARKISGLHRSQLGIDSREIMMSEIITAEHRNENPFEIIQDGIEKYNLS